MKRFDGPAAFHTRLSVQGGVERHPLEIHLSFSKGWRRAIDIRLRSLSASASQPDDIATPKVFEHVAGRKFPSSVPKSLIRPLANRFGLGQHPKHTAHNDPTRSGYTGFSPG